MHHGESLRTEVQSWLQKTLLLDAGACTPFTEPCFEGLVAQILNVFPPILFLCSQEPKTDKDEEYCRKVNEYLNNPPMPGTLGSSGSGGHDLSALGGNARSYFTNLTLETFHCCFGCHLFKGRVDCKTFWVT